MCLRNLLLLSVFYLPLPHVCPGDCRKCEECIADERPKKKPPGSVKNANIKIVLAIVTGVLIVWRRE